MWITTSAAILTGWFPLHTYPVAPRPGVTVLVTASPLDPGLAAAAGAGPATTASRGSELAGELLELMGLSDVRVVTGAEATGTLCRQVNAAGRAIAEEYARMIVAVDAVKNELAAALPVGSWLAERLLDVPPFVQLGATLTLGDSVLVPFVPGFYALAQEVAAGTVVHHHVNNARLWDDLLQGLAARPGPIHP